MGEKENSVCSFSKDFELFNRSFCISDMLNPLYNFVSAATIRPKIDDGDETLCFDSKKTSIIRQLSVH